MSQSSLNYMFLVINEEGSGYRHKILMPTNKT